MRRSVPIAVLASLVLPAAGAAAPPGGPVDQELDEPRAVIVRFDSDATAAQRRAARRAAGVRRDEALPLPGTEVADPMAGTTVAEAVEALEDQPGVRYAEPDQPRRALRTPNDPLFPRLYALPLIGAPAAWDTTVGGDVRVAIIDTGVDLGHPGLVGNLWANPGETGDGREGNGFDDDGSGFVDDVRGADLVEDGAQPYDGNGHGTHVAGTVAATGDDAIGTTGVAWRAQLVPVRVLGNDGSGTASDVIEGYRYAARVGVEVANLSLGGDAPSRAEREALAAAPGVLFVAAAGNDGLDLDTEPSFPCEYDLPNVVCVGATDEQDALAPFSNFGPEVDLAAPGVDIGSTWPGGRHVLLSGTSMAAPHVAGAVVLALAKNPALAPARLVALLRATAARSPSLDGRVATGRLDVAALLQAVPAPVTAEPPPPPAASTADPATPSAAPSTTMTPAPTRPASAADTRPPGVSVIASRTIRRTTLARRGLVVRVRCSEGCRVTAQLRRDARRLVRATGRRSTQGSVTRRLRARTSRGRVTLVVVARDAAGNPRTRRITVRVA